MKFTAEQYVDSVLNGEQVACKWVRLACERHRCDLEEGSRRGLYFDERAAKVVVAFFSLLKHFEGEWAGQPIVLEPWQQAHFWILFGWRRADGTRRFRTSYMEVARKNGKSTIAAGAGLYLLVADGEPGAQVYTAATKRDQARIIHKAAINMVKQSELLRHELELFHDNINYPAAFSKFAPLGQDSKTEDGLNVHGAMIDELHAHPTGDMWDILETATGARRQPLIYAITTAGTDRQSICYQMHDYTKKVLSGVVQDDSHYGIIYTLDREETDESAGEGPVEDWRNEAAWVKANPNLGVSKKLDNMRDKAGRAAELPARLTAFLQKELNIWTQSAEKWIVPEKWDACGVYQFTEADLLGRDCYSGLDLSSNTDTTALVHVFPPVDEDGLFYVLCRFWIPEENIMARVRKDRVPYDAWQRQGLLTATPGEIIDYDFILQQIDEDAQKFNIQEIAFDRWGASRIQTKLMEMGGDDWLVQFGQGFASMNGPMKMLEAYMLKRRIDHGGHPVLRWMADNVVAVRDPADNIKPDKSKSTDRIDGIVALIMGLGRAVIGNKHKKDSVYKKRGLREV